MAPHAENQKVKKKIEEEILEKLKLDEEKEKKKLEKEAKRRAELEKMKNESLIRQADLLVPLKKEKQPVQPKKNTYNTQSKTTRQKKQQSHNLENKNDQVFSFEFNTQPKTSSWNKKQPVQFESRIRNDSFSSEKSWKRDDDWRNYQTSSQYESVADSIWNNKNEHFPMLGAEAPVPQVNVWEERKYKHEEIQALQPRNEYDEEAMLRQALALSMLEATKENERKQKLDEEYRLQMEALECNPKILDTFKEPDEITVTDKSELESRVAVESSEGQSHNQKFSRNVAIASIIQKSKTSNPGGARPKINKIIDKFGGWGLKDNKENSNSLSNFENDVEEKSSKKAWKYNHPPGFQKDVINNKTKAFENVGNWETSDVKIEKSTVSDSWSNAYNSDSPKSSASDLWGNEVLHEQKETSFNVGEVSLSYLNSATDYCDVSSKETENRNDKIYDDVTGEWPNSADEPAPISNQWDDEFSDEKPAVTRKRNSVRYPGSSSSNNTITKCENVQIPVSNVGVDISMKDTSHEYSSKVCDSVDFYTKSSLVKDMSTDSCGIQEEKELPKSNIFSESESMCNYVEDTSKSKDELAPAETLLSADDIWSNKSPNDSAASNSTFQNQSFLQTEFPGEEASFKFGTVEESNILKPMISDNEIDTPPILPPHSVAAVPQTNESNEIFATEISGNEYTEELPPILPPQASPQMPSPYLFNPAVFPGVNPMFGVGMDPITVRQMLMLSNPFFASQLLAMEQYYRAMGMPVDLFSFPTQPVPNMLFPGLANTSDQNTLPNPANVNVSPVHNSLQNHYPNQSVLSENPNSISSEGHLTNYSSGLDQNAADTVKNPWYTTVLPSDVESVIPPPKPPPLNTNDKIPSTFVPQPSEAIESASSFSYNRNSKDYVNSNPPSNLLENESHKTIRAVETCMTKSEVSGWGNLDDENFHKSKSKTNSWEDDFSWGTDNLPAKSVKIPSTHEDKKVVHRQPARQPQLSRFQRNRRFN